VGIATARDPKGAAKETRERLDAKAAKDAAALTDVMTDWLKRLTNKLSQAKFRHEADAIIAAATEDIGKDAKVAKAFHDAALVSQIAGRLDMAQRLQLYARQPDIINLSADEAIEAFRGSQVYEEKLFAALLGEVEDRAGSAQADMVDQLRERLQAKTLDALNEGMTFKEFADALTNPEFNGLGIDESHDGYLRMAFRTNVNIAYSSGKWDQADEVKNERPYWQYLTLADAHVRTTHRPLDGAVFRFGEASTEVFMPPIDFNCRCIWVSLAEVPTGAKLYEAGNVPATFRSALNPTFVGW